MIDQQYRQIPLHTTEAAIAEELRAGLTSPQKTLPPKWLYDNDGSHLFEKICELPEYYPTRTERRILQADSDSIIDLCGKPLSLVELGSGSSKKTRHLIDACLDHQTSLTYHAIDISPAALDMAADWIVDEYDSVAVVGLAGDYEAALDYLDGHTEFSKLYAFLGSTLGNFEDNELHSFLRMIRSHVSDQDNFLVGVDLLKSDSILLPAYNDSQGVTAEFNLNCLARLNREFDGEFDLDTFRHQAVFNSDLGRIEMHLVSETDQQVTVPGLELELEFQKGEFIHTENSYKRSEEMIEALFKQHGFDHVETFKDDDNLFALMLLR
ncbi:MAG: L-histidine N(alpha)-methyltransferase [Gemmataceae bacterium]